MNIKSMQTPLFPLSTIVMPGGLLPLQLFEPRYLDLVRNCFRQQTGFGICLIKEGAEAGDVAVPYPYGTLIKIIDWGQGDNGLLQVVVEGEQKFRIVDTWQDDAKLLHGNIKLLPVEKPSPVSEEYGHLVQTMQHILLQVAPGIVYENPMYDDALWMSSRFVELLPLSAERRHELFSMDDPQERLTAVADVFNAISNSVKEV